jgi:hypothetical protein
MLGSCLSRPSAWRASGRLIPSVRTRCCRCSRPMWHGPDDFGTAVIPTALRGTSDLSTCGLSEAMGIEWPAWRKAAQSGGPLRARPHARAHLAGDDRSGSRADRARTGRLFACISTSRLGELVADRVAHESGKREEFELALGGRPMCLHRLDADGEDIGDLPARVSFGDQLSDLSLSGRKRRSRLLAPGKERAQ